MSPRIVDKKQKREQILRAAFGVFATRGLYDFKMIDIARAAGVGKGTLYEYFNSKEELIAGCSDLFVADYERHIQQRLQSSDDPARQIEQFFRITFEFFGRQKERLQLIFDLWAYSYRSGTMKADTAGWLESFHAVREEIAQVVRQGIKRGRFRKANARLTAAVVLGTIDGLLFQAALGIIRIDDRRLPMKIAKTFLEGIMA
jgi:AcrR family transcriptional regulator